MKLTEIASKLGLTPPNEEREIVGLASLADATPNHLSFFENPKYAKELATSRAGAVLIAPAYVGLLPKGAIALVTEEPYLMLARASALFAPPPIEEGEAIIDPSARIMPGAYVGKGAVVGANALLFPGVFVGDAARIGEGTILYPNVVVYRDCVIGNRCIIHAGTVIGSDGYGFAHTRSGEHVKIYQNGNVVVEDDVEIGANCTVDRAVFGSTIIRRGTKIDNLVQIGHNCDIGEYVLMAAQVGISGSTTLGRNVVMGGQSATAGHLTIGPFATIAARGGVTKSLSGHKTYAGFPIMEHRLWLSLQALLARMVKRETK